MMKGRSSGVKHNLISKVTDIIESTLEVNRDQIKIEIQELEEDNFAIGRVIAEELK